MVPYDVFSNEMNIGRPPFLKLFIINTITARRDVINERVKPDISYMIIVER